MLIDDDNDAQDMLELFEKKAKKKLLLEKKFNIEKDDSDDDDDDPYGNVNEKSLKQDFEIIRKATAGFEEEGSNYFECCSKEKIHTISSWCNQILNTMDLDSKQQKYIRKKLHPVRLEVRALADPKTSLHEKRKILQKFQVGDGVMSVLSTILVPMIRNHWYKKKGLLYD